MTKQLSSKPYWIFVFLLLSVACQVSAQTELMRLHSGISMEVKVLRTDTYSYTVRLISKGGVEAQYSKYAIHTIRYESGIIDTVSERISIESEADWNKVILVEDKSALAGCIKVGEVKGHSAFLNLHTPTSANYKALEKLKRAAARMGAPFVLLVFDRESALLPILRGLGGFQCQKNGFAYRY